MRKLEKYLQERCDQYVSEFEKRDNSATETKIRLLKEREAQVLNVRARAKNRTSSLD